MHEARGRLQIGVHEGLGHAAFDPAQRRGAGGRYDVATQDQIGAAGGDADGRDIFRRRGDPDVAHDRAVLLREPGEVQRRAASAVDMRGHAEQRADGDDAGATDAGDKDVVGRIELGGGGQRQMRRQRQAGKRILAHVPGRALQLAQASAMHGDEARAEAFDAGIILVAVRLVDLALAAELSVERLHRDTIGGLGAVAAAFADQIIDKDALGRIGIEPALAAAALFGGAGLVVDQDRQPLDLAQLALQLVHLATVMDGRSHREIIARIFFGIIGDDGDALGAFGPDLMRDLRDCKAALGRLPAGHGNRIIIKNLVGDADA